MVTCAITPVRGLLGQVPSFVDLPPWSLNASYTKLERLCGKDNPLQNGPSHCTQSISIPPVGGGSWLE